MKKKSGSKTGAKSVSSAKTHSRVRTKKANKISRTKIKPTKTVVEQTEQQDDFDTLLADDELVDNSPESDDDCGPTDYHEEDFFSDLDEEDADV